MQLAFVVDFDGTITKNDVGHSIIKNFAEKGWNKWEDMWIEKKINTQMCAEMMWGMVKESPETITEYVKKFEFNPGFNEFCTYTKEKNYKLIVASDGFDFYINTIMKNCSINDIDIVSSNLVYDNGWKFNFPNINTECGQCGCCKKSIVDDLIVNGYKVCYIGDGYSDRCGCKNSDIIFAKSYLAGFCKDEKIPYIEFKDFFQVVDYFKTNGLGLLK